MHECRRKWRLGLLLVLLVAGVPACSDLLVKTEPAPLFYQLDYPLEPVGCPRGFARGVRIWEFAADTPYERPEMVVAGEGSSLRYSDRHQWVAYPGRMLADRLIRDLNAGPLFPLAVGEENPVALPLELTGRVGAFAWRQEATGGHALLEVDVSLVEKGTPNRVLLRRHYNCAGSAAPDGADAFARAMSAAAAEFSRALQRDLCREASRSAEKEGTTPTD